MDTITPCVGKVTVVAKFLQSKIHKPLDYSKQKLVFTMQLCLSIIQLQIQNKEKENKKNNKSLIYSYML